MISPSGRVPQQGLDWFFVATEACGGGTPDLGYVLGVSVYIELELRSVELQGGHEAGGAPHPRGKGVGPLALILSPVFFIISKNNLREVSGHSENFYFCTKITPWQFC